MELSTWLLFSSIALIATISPGPAVLLSVTNGLMHGFTRSVFSSLGNITGILIVSSAAALGLGAVLQSSTFLFTTLKFCGAIYLIYLGIRQWRLMAPCRIGSLLHWLISQWDWRPGKLGDCGSRRVLLRHDFSGELIESRQTQANGVLREITVWVSFTL